MPIAKLNAFEKSFVDLAGFARALSHPARIQVLRELAGRGEVACMEIVNIPGFAAGNIRDGMLFPEADLRSAGAQIIDVRPSASVAKLPVPGAKNIPLCELRTRLTEIDRSQPVFTICQMGKTSYFAARILASHGFDARSILGGAHHQVR